jgi:5,6-dimethylbenzimidazole synthase
MSSPELALADLYSVIHRRRDVRTGYTGGPVADDVLGRILEAAHAAPSVGLSQPWDFIVVRRMQTRQQFHAHVMGERDIFASTLSSERREVFDGIRIEGILESTLSIVVTYDHTRAAPAVLGRNTIADAGLYSVCLAIENLWLAATAEGLGMGWVSFYRESFLSELVHLPDHVRPIAWLCLGPITHFESEPDLERHRWRSRDGLASVIHQDRW